MQPKADTATLESCVRRLALAKIANRPESIVAAWKALQPVLLNECARHNTLNIRVASKFKCSACKRPGETCRLPECMHDICPSCAEKEVARVSSHTFDRRILRAQCPCCKECLTEAGVKLFYTDEQISRLREERKGKGVTRVCPICMDEFSVEEQGISLECNHMFCAPCLVHYVESCIQDNKVSDEFLACPTCKKVPIDDQIISHWVSKEMFDKLVNLRLRNVVGSEEFYKYCPDCEVGGFIKRGDKVFRCPKCEKEMCPNCNVSPPHKGDCQKTVLPDWVTMCGIKVCPRCGALIERASGCNFMTCKSAKCQSKVYFCYLCGFELKKEEHYSHYKKKGPWGEFCNNTEKEYLVHHKA